MRTTTILRHLIVSGLALAGLVSLGWSQTHPRLIVSPSELAAARTKVNATGTWSKSLFQNAVNDPKPNVNPTSYVAPDFWTALYASQPMVGLLGQLPNVDPVPYCQSAINTSLGAIRTFEPPYPDDSAGWPEWYARFTYRYIALTYDACYGQISVSERSEFQEELLRIVALINSERFAETANNHKLVLSIDVALAALAIEPEVPNSPRTYTNEPVVRTTTTPAGDFLKYRSLVSITCVGPSPGVCQWVPGTDYTTLWIRKDRTNNSGGPWPFDYGTAIRWVAGRGPAAGATYYVSYTFTPDFPIWKDRVKSALQRNLDHTWGDGASHAGLFYGSWSMNWMLDAFEAMKRSGGYDFSTHPTVRDAVLWYPSELITPRSAQTLRVNNRNDSNYDELDQTASPGAPTYLAWLMTALKDDPGGRDDVAYWLLQKSTRWFSNARWREALWVNDAYSGPPPLAPAAPLTLPLSRFFKAHNLANFRSGAWDGPNTDWALFSLPAGPYQAAEHTQADRGSFTFYALGQEFAIDNGYPSFGTLGVTTAAHNYLLAGHKLFSANQALCLDAVASYDGQEATGSAEARSAIVSDLSDSIHVDLRRSYVPDTRLPLVGSPCAWPVQTAERFGLLVKRPGRAPYALVADSMNVDGTARQYTWVMHTAGVNTIAITGQKATISGGLGATPRPTMDVYLFGAAPVTLSQDVWNLSQASSVGPHPRLLANSTTINPRYLAVLVPEKAADPNALVVTSSSTASAVSVTVAGGGLTDKILHNLTANTAISGNNIDTDGSLALVRLNAGGVPTSWTVQNATYLRYGGTDYWRVVAPTTARASITYDGSKLTVIGDDVTEFRAQAPGQSSFESTNGVLPAGIEGQQLHWKGSKRLLDVAPVGAFALDESFSNAVGAYWVHYALESVYSRVENGEYCTLSTTLPSTTVSYTNRSYAPHRTDTFQYPRSSYTDATWSGEFKVAAKPAGAKFNIMARVADRNLDETTMTWPQKVDQDYVKVEIDVDTGNVVLKKRLGGGAAVEQTLTATGPRTIGALVVGQKYAYSLSLTGTTINFSVGGNLIASATDSSGSFPTNGYFQWEVPTYSPTRLKVCFDNTKIALPGTTLDATPPAATTSLAANLGRDTAVLTWTAPGDDGGIGQATTYDLRYAIGSSCPITEATFSSAIGIPTGSPLPPGLAECVQFTSYQRCTSYCFALKTADEAGNWSPLSNVVSAYKCDNKTLQVFCE